MVTIGMNYHVLPGKEDVFEAAFARVLEAIESADGHDASRLYKGVGGGPNADYLIVSRWGNETAFQEFIASDAFKKVTNWGAENILAGRPSHTTYQEG
ncbi:MAG: antibiotic biosynthesis monooxygenase [Myxococcales bacterium]|nr:antibiotic biosynthesis monooxygenase [Myxococcales bacterium]